MSINTSPQQMKQNGKGCKGIQQHFLYRVEHRKRQRDKGEIKQTAQQRRHKPRYGKLRPRGPDAPKKRSRRRARHTPAHVAHGVGNARKPDKGDNAETYRQRITHCEQKTYIRLRAVGRCQVKPRAVGQAKHVPRQKRQTKQQRPPVGDKQLTPLRADKPFVHLRPGARQIFRRKVLFVTVAVHHFVEKFRHKLLLARPLRQRACFCTNKQAADNTAFTGNRYCK